jgi:uncharacterized membrane-anchored protein YitT (DUF2179 family)
MPEEICICLILFDAANSLYLVQGQNLAGFFFLQFPTNIKCIIIIISYYNFLSRGTSPLEPMVHLTPLRLQVPIAARSLLCAMFLVQLLLADNLLKALLVLFTDIFKSFSYNSSGPNDYRSDEAFHIPHSLDFCTYSGFNLLLLLLSSSLLLYAVFYGYVVRLPANLVFAGNGASFDTVILCSILNKFHNSIHIY